MFHEVGRQSDAITREGLFLPPDVAEHHLRLVRDVLAVWLLDFV